MATCYCNRNTVLIVLLAFFLSFSLDTMVCTGCCSSLDHIVTYLFKQLSRSTKKRSTPMAQESDRFLHIMQQHPEMIQQVRRKPALFLVYLFNLILSELSVPYYWRNEKQMRYTKEHRSSQTPPIYF